MPKPSCQRDTNKSSIPADRPPALRLLAVGPARWNDELGLFEIDGKTNSTRTITLRVSTDLAQAISDSLSGVSKSSLHEDGCKLSDIAARAAFERYRASKEKVKSIAAAYRVTEPTLYAIWKKLWPEEFAAAKRRKAIAVYSPPISSAPITKPNGNIL